MKVGTRPTPFTGTPTQKRLNRLTHQFTPNGEEPPDCLQCGVAVYHVAADYPCGTDVPREEINVEGATLADLHPNIGLMAPYLKDE